jgi:hypothetical protein
MPRKSKVTRFNEVLEEIAADLMATTKTELKKKKWKTSFLDVRYFGKIGSNISKVRVELPNGDFQSLSESDNVSQLLSEVWRLRENPFPGKWYGLKLFVLPNGECKTEFNYDPKCSEDPTFFDT